MKSDLNQDYLWIIACMDSCVTSFQLKCCDMLIDNFRKKYLELGEVYADQLNAILNNIKSTSGNNSREPKINDIS